MIVDILSLIGFLAVSKYFIVFFVLIASKIEILFSPEKQFEIFKCCIKV